LLLQHPDARRVVSIGLSRDASYPLLSFFVPFFMELDWFCLLATEVKKTNKKPKDYIIKRTKN